jgi:hypothetical protein
MRRASQRQLPEMNTLRFTKGMAPAPLSSSSLARSGERATVALRGWLWLIPKAGVGFPAHGQEHQHSRIKKRKTHDL